MRLALKFDDPDKEREFCEDYAKRHLPYMRFVFGLAAPMYAGFAVLDMLVASDALGRLLFIRFGIVCPLIVLALLSTYTHTSFFLRFGQAIMAFLGFVAGLGIVAMTLVASPPTSHAYYAGIMLVLIAVFTFCGLHVRAASAAGWAVILSYFATTWIDPPPRELLISNTFFLVGFGLFGAAGCYTIERLARQRFTDLQTIERANDQLAELAMRDPLTGLLNRRRLEERLAEAIAMFRRYQQPACFVLIDLDGFKAINDSYGHQAGDGVLEAVARVLTEHVRDTDLLYRFGGDEFCIVMPNTQLETTELVGKRILAALRAVDVDGVGEQLTVGFSAGAVPVSAATITAADILAQADQLLYEAKRGGKGRMIAAADAA